MNKLLLSWNDVTVSQFEELYLIDDKKTMPVYDKLTANAAVLFDKTIDQVESMSIDDQVALVKASYELLNTNCPAIPKRKIKLNGKRYRIEYNLSKLSEDRQQRLNAIDKSPMNLHKILAVLVYPVNRFGRQLPVDYTQHEQDMLLMPIVSVKGACIFFFDWLEKAYLTITNLGKGEMLRSIINENEKHFQNVKTHIVTNDTKLNELFINNN
jgi:hypothetical protein